MSEHFEPSNAFEGYVKASLDNMEKRLDTLPCGETFKQLNKIENEVENIKGKASIIGAVFGFIAGIIGKAVFWK